MTEVEFDGLDVLMAYIDNISVVQDASSILKKHVSKCADKSMKLVPVDTGTLKRSQKVNLKPMQGTISYNTNYAAYVEYGTRFMQAKHYLQTPFITESMAFMKEIRELTN